MSAMGQKRTYAVRTACPLYPKNGHLLEQNVDDSNPLELLPARSRNKAPDLRPTFIVLVRPYYGQPELVWYGY